MKRIAIALLSACLASAGGTVFAADKDPMSTARKDAMAKDSMAKDAMAKDSMAKDSMAKDSMAKDSMAAETAKAKKSQKSSKKHDMAREPAKDKGAM